MENTKNIVILHGKENTGNWDMQLYICKYKYISIILYKKLRKYNKAFMIFFLGAKIRGSFPFSLHINFTQNVIIAKV